MLALQLIDPIFKWCALLGHNTCRTAALLQSRGRTQYQFALEPLVPRLGVI